MADFQMNVYIKSEPSGEYSIGSISKEDLNGYGILGSKPYDERFELDVVNHSDIFHAYGVAVSIADDWGSILSIDLSHEDKAKIIESAVTKFFNLSEEYIAERGVHVLNNLDPGYYVIMTAPTKYSAEFEINTGEGDFDASLLKLVFTDFSFPKDVVDSYGPIRNCLLTDIEYNGDSERDGYIDSMVDRGYRREISVIEVLEDKTYKVVWTS